MSIIINSENRLEKNLLIRNGYMASYKHLRRDTNLETTYYGGSIFTGNWNKGSWYWEGIQRSYQKFDPKMLELRTPIMDEKWFAIILMHITNWEHKYSQINSKSIHYLRIDLEKLLEYLKEKNWELNSLDNSYIQSVNEEYVYVHKELINLFFNEINSQEKFLHNYAYKEFIKNNKSTEYIWIPGEITDNILKQIENKKYIKIANESIHIRFDEKKDEQVLFEFEFKNYIENYITNIDGKFWYTLTPKFLEDLEKLLALNQNNKLTQEEFDSLVDKMPLMIELKKESKILSKKDKISLMKTQTDLLKKWSLPKSFNQFRNYLLESAISSLIKNKLIYSVKEKEENSFKLGKNHIGVNVFIDDEEKLKNIASDDQIFAENFRKHFNVLPIEKYDQKYEKYHKEKDYIFFEVNEFLNLEEKKKYLYFRY